MPIRIMFACGGTAGHINPALAVADTLCKEHSDTQILFVGNPNGMEATLVPKAGYDFAPLDVQGFQRKINLDNIKRNAKAAALLLSSSAKCKKIITSFAPDIVMGTGGYVSGPVLRTAAKLGYKTISHESNAFPGLTTKILAKYVDKILLAVECAAEHLPKNTHYVVTGNPIRQDILFVDRDKARAELGIDNRICLLTFGGSLGAQRLNEAVADVVAWHSGKGYVHHIHATGQYGTEIFPALLKERGVDYKTDNHLDIKEYIHNMPQCLVAADLVICRAGALTLSELQAAGRASILIPSPNVSENHQYHNAMVLAGNNAAIVIEEKNLTGELLCENVEMLILDHQERKNLEKNALLMSIIDANQRICKEIYSLLEQ